MYCLHTISCKLSRSGGSFAFFPPFQNSGFNAELSHRGELDKAANILRSQTSLLIDKRDGAAVVEFELQASEVARQIRRQWRVKRSGDIVRLPRVKTVGRVQVAGAKYEARRTAAF